MATGVTTPTGSQPAKSSSEILSSLNAEQTREWRSTGKLPDEKSQVSKESTEAASSPAAKETSEPPAKATETPAGSVPAKEEPKGKGAEGRIKELLAKNKQLETELEAFRKAPAAAPAKKQEELAKPHRLDVDEKTGLQKYASDDEFLDARDAYVAEMASRKTRDDIAKENKDRVLAEQNRIIEQRWLNSLKVAEELYSDFATVTKRDDKGTFQHPDLKKIPDNSILDQRILKSSVSGVMLYYFASHPGEVDRLLAITDGFDLSDEIRDLEQKLAKSISTPPKKSDDEPSDAAAPTPKPKVPGAPAPAADVGGKSTAPVDPIIAALNKGNFTAYQKEQDALDHARKRKR